MKTLTLEDVLALIQKQIEQLGGQAEFARAVGVGRAHVNDVLSGRRIPGPAILSYMKLERHICFTRTEN